MSLKWIDIFDIAMELEDNYPNEDIISLSFPRLKSLVLSLEEFQDDPAKSNEKILEAIQMQWLKERQ